MKNFIGRTSEPKDATNYWDWLKAASGINLVDTTVYSEPSCTHEVKTDVVSLSLAQNLALIRVLAGVTSGTGGNSVAEVALYEVFVQVVQ
jgi:hypothetical protein